MRNLIHRPRRLRRTDTIRRMVRENHVTADDLLYPMFVTMESESREIPSMPGVFRYTLEDLCRTVEKFPALGLPAIMLFGIPAEKDEVGSGGYAEDGIVPQAIRKLRRVVGNSMLIVPDVCLCEYTSHGHCGVIRDGHVDNDPTLELLSRTAVCYAEAGADVIAPSDMMDGRIGALREGLDGAGFSHLPIMAYSAKYASGFYGRSERRRTAPRSSGIAGPIRWIRPTAARRSERWNSMSLRVRTS